MIAIGSGLAAAIGLSALPKMMGILMLAAMAMAVLPNVKDASLKISRALPASTVAVSSATGIDTGLVSGAGFQTFAQEYLITAPLVTTAQLPDTKTFTYDIITSPNSDMSSPTVQTGLGCLVQTGAGAAGAAAATKRIRPASDWGRYIGLKITPSAAGTGDASATTATLEMVA